jgi:hypothetical protein
MTIQGFLSDQSLIDKSKSLINFETLNIPCGFLDRDTVEYFVEPLEISDLRPERLLITYRQESQLGAPDRILAEHTLTNILAAGEQHIFEEPDETVTLAQYIALNGLEFENDVLPTDPTRISSNREIKLTIDFTKLDDTDKTALQNLSASKQRNLFNIFEYLMYGTLSVDEIADINIALALNPNLYGGYVANSIKRSGMTAVKVYGGINIHRFLPNYFEFDFVTDNGIVTFSVWSNKTDFRANYPYTTIINIIPPLPLDKLLNPSTLDVDPLETAIDSKDWSDDIVAPELVNRDQTGMYIFETRYVFNGKTYSVNFSLIYRGRQPDSMEARNYIADYLLNSGIGTRALWELLVPDIFYRSSFALVPFYDDITVQTNIDIYPSITNISASLNKLNAIVSNIPRANDPTREFISVAYDKFFVGVAPADVNEQNSLMEIHNTYRDFSTTDTGFNEMKSVDRVWSTKLNQAIAVAVGQVNLGSFSKVKFGSGDLEWINFVYNYVSYNILTKTSYDKFFENNP